MNKLKKMYFATIVISIIILIIYVNSEFRFNSFSIKSNKNDETIFEYNNNYKLEGRDESYLFYNNEEKELVKVSKTKRIIKEELYTNSFYISSAIQKDSFEVTLRDKLTISKLNFKTDEDIFVLSDVEGNYKVFIEWLKNNNILNNNLNWIFGKGHLVLNGDFFDRGNDVTATLWLIYKLEKEAERNGGKIHFIIGNHEEMNLRGFVKYVNKKYLAIARELDISYKDLYGENSELGRWLRTKNAIITINKNLFCHAGVSPEFAKRNLTLSQANSVIRESIGKDKKKICSDDATACFLYGREGVMWYRGYFGDYKDYYKGITQKEVDDITNHFNIDHIIVGHTIVEKIESMFNNKIIAIDVMNEKDPRRQDDGNMATELEGLLIKDTDYYRVLQNGEKELLFTDKK